jgi:hypothetical protein
VGNRFAFLEDTDRLLQNTESPGWRDCEERMSRLVANDSLGKVLFTP